MAIQSYDDFYKNNNTSKIQSYDEFYKNNKTNTSKSTTNNKTSGPKTNNKLNTALNIFQKWNTVRKVITNPALVVPELLGKTAANYTNQVITDTKKQVQQAKSNGNNPNVGDTLKYLGGNAASGFISVPEGIADLGAAGLKVAGKATSKLVNNKVGKFIFGEDAADYKNNPLYQIGQGMVDDEISKDVAKMTSNKYGKTSYVGDDSMLTGVAQGIGQVGGLIATGNFMGLKGNLPTNTGSKVFNTIAQSLNEPTSSAMFLSVSGNSYTEALKDGATEGEAIVYGLLNGAKETATEVMYGGLGSAFGTGAIDDVVKKAVTSHIKNKVLQKTAEFGIGMAAEGVEEIVATLIDPFIKYVYKHELDFSDYKNLLNDFVIGFLTSGVLQGGQITMNNMLNKSEVNKAKETYNDVMEEQNTLNNTNTNTIEKIVQNAPQNVSDSVSEEELQTQIDTSNAVLEELKSRREKTTQKAKQERLDSQINNLTEQVENLTKEVNDTNKTITTKKYLNKNNNIQQDIKNFAEQVANRNLIAENNDLVVLNSTPLILQDLGIDNLPMTITKNHINTALRPKNSHNSHFHGLTENIINQIPKALQNPLNVMQSLTDGNSIVVVTEIDDGYGNLVVVPIKVKGGYGTVNQIDIDSNALTSIYGKDNGYDSWMQRHINTGNMLYDADEGIKKRFTPGLQLPNDKSLSNTNSTTNDSKSQTIVLPTNNNMQKSQNNTNLSQSEQQELDTLINLPFDLDTEQENRINYLQNKRDGKIKYPELKNKITFQDIKTEYNKYKDLSDFDNKVLKDAESVVPSYRDTGRRTKTEWLNVAELIGSNIDTTSNEGLTKYAIQSWFSAKPNIKDNLNRQGNKYVKFGIDEWVNAVYKGAGVGKTISNTKSIKNVLPTEKLEKKTKNIMPLSKNSDMVIKASAEKIASQLNNSKQRSWVETSTESDVLKDKVLIKDLDVNKINYIPQSNQKSLDLANAELDRIGYENAIEEVRRMMDGKEAKHLPRAEDVALAERLLQEAAKRGDTQLAQELVMDISIMGTDLGQATQALSIIQKLTPEGQLKMYETLVKRAKARGETSFENVQITPEMVEKILRVYKENGTFDQTELNQAVEEFKQDIADQLKTTTGEKIDAWRYLAMLGNPKTHIRNIVSNVAMKGTIKVKNAMARTSETAISKIAPYLPKNMPIIGKFNTELAKVADNRTKTWKKSSDYINDFAKTTANEMKSVITGEAKYNEKTSIESKKQIFKNKTLEKISDFNSNALEAEDWFFSKKAFQDTLAEYLTANNINTEEDIKNNTEIVQKGINYSVEQAEIATFRQYSKLASSINQFERKHKTAGYAIKATVPFKKTPINVAKAGAKYSPLGLIKNVSYDAYQLQKGNINASQFIDNLAQGLTGTSLTILGYVLAKAGFLKGAGDDDKEGKYDSQLGDTEYSIKIGGNSYSLSWLSPVAMPLFVGTNIFEQLEEEKDWDANVIVDTLAKTLDPLNEMSFLQSLTNVLTSYSSGTQKLAGMGESMVQNYTSQFFPTLFGQFASVFDNKKRSTKVSKNSPYRFGEQTVRNIMYKIPGLRNKLEATTDIWGNEKEQSSNILERTFESFIAPYTKTKVISSDLDDEIKDIYNETGNTKVIPGIPNAYVEYKKETYKMSASEYTQYKKTYGNTASGLLNTLINSSSYNSATDEDKATMISNVYDYAKAKANEEYFKNTDIDYQSKLLNKINGLNNMYGISASTYFGNKNEYDYAYSYENKYRTFKQIASYDKYNTYKKALDNIRNNTNDKKNATIKYINSLKLSIPQKAMFIREYYPSFDEYNEQIIKYINNQKLSKNEKTQILQELGFTIKDGRVYW